MTDALSTKELDLIDAYWRAASYLTVGQIYLMDNPLLRAPLEPAHIKPRLLGYWGTSPGQNLIYASAVLSRHEGHTRAHLKDLPEVRDGTD